MTRTVKWTVNLVVMGIIFGFGVSIVMFLTGYSLERSMIWFLAAWHVYEQAKELMK